MKNARKLAKNTGRNVGGPWKSAGDFWKLLRFWLVPARKMIPVRGAPAGKHVFD